MQAKEKMSEVGVHATISRQATSEEENNAADGPLATIWQELVLLVRLDSV